MKNKKADETTKYPKEYENIFKFVAGDKNSVKQNEEINQLRQAAAQISEPQYTTSTSTTGESPVFRINAS
jgi:hypothetical protein